MYNVHISERMAEILEEDKVTIKEEISTVEDTFTVFVAEDVKEESTENQGMVHYSYISLLLKNVQHETQCPAITNLNKR